MLRVGPFEPVAVAVAGPRALLLVGPKQPLAVAKSGTSSPPRALLPELRTPAGGVLFKTDDEKRLQRVSGRISGTALPLGGNR